MAFNSRIGESHLIPAGWEGDEIPAPFSEKQLSTCLGNLHRPVFLMANGDELFVTNEGNFSSPNRVWKVAAYAPPYPAENLGDPEFRKTYGLKFGLYGGSMANGISSVEFVEALGQAGFMGSFGAGGLLPEKVEQAIVSIQGRLTGKPYAFNLINSPYEPALEQRAAELYLRYAVRVIEASAYLTLTNSLVRYRAAGLAQNPDGSIRIDNRIIAKVSRKEVASKFLQPPPEDILNHLLSDGLISPEQARLANHVPMADDITVEGDSGGHTDNRPLVGILPAIIQLRDEMQERHKYPVPVRIGAAGGIATPASTLAAFIMGAAYVVTGSINQACVESAASDHTKKLLAQMEMTDVAMAPASDMFEMGVKVQVLKRGTMFPMRALKLYELYTLYNSIEDLPTAERERLEKTVFKQGLDQVWEECIRFFTARDPRQLERAEKNPKDKMALIFRWYLGLSSRWSNVGEKGREMDYQIWCGPAMGAFNDWVKGSSLEQLENRRTAEVALHLLKGAGLLARIRMLESQGVQIPSRLAFKLMG